MNDPRLLHWVELLEGELGSKVTQDGDTIRLKPATEIGLQKAGIDQPTCISFNPVDALAWKERLQYVEKLMAKAILSGPVGFACQIHPQDLNPVIRAGGVKAIRMSFGLSLSNGKSCRRQYTAYYLPEMERGFYIQGEDSLFDLDLEVSDLNHDLELIKTCLPHLFDELHKTEIFYLEDPLVRKQISMLSAARAAELRDLERFYSPYPTEYLCTLGKSSKNVLGQDAVETEYSRKLEDTLKKYRTAIVFEPLSLGVISCFLERGSSEDPVEHRLPFIDPKFFGFILNRVEDNDSSSTHF